ncbi:MAG: sugar phosphate isomerase/epimerase family protein [Planctomycetia bacterium]
MRYLYFTKSLQSLDVDGLVAFLTDAGLGGADLAVRPGHPVDPKNAEKMLPTVARRFNDAGLAIPNVTAPTGLLDADSADAKRIFAACAAAGVATVKIGYFPYTGDFQAGLGAARKAMAGFAKLSETTGVRALYHTHAGKIYGSNASAVRLLLDGLDPHHVGAFLDTGHLVLGGEPFPLAIDVVAPWFSLLAIKDVVWTKEGAKWRYDVAPAGAGVVAWADVGAALVKFNYQGWTVLHGEYPAADLADRLAKAKAEKKFLDGLGA